MVDLHDDENDVTDCAHIEVGGNNSKKDKGGKEPDMIVSRCPAVL